MLAISRRKDDPSPRPRLVLNLLVPSVFELASDFRTLLIQHSLSRWNACMPGIRLEQLLDPATPRVRFQTSTPSLQKDQVIHQTNNTTHTENKSPNSPSLMPNNHLLQPHPLLPPPQILHPLQIRIPNRNSTHNTLPPLPQRQLLRINVLELRMGLLRTSL